MHMAQSAATRDPRFHPVRPDELKDVHVEISVLSVPKELRYDSPEDLLAKLRPGLDGVVLRVGSRQSTYLPQVWEQLPDKTDFMNHLAEKAGLAPDDWRQKDAAILIYQVEAFEEPEK
jgi:AmmeMemoRadiSam system protein A